MKNFDPLNAASRLTRWLLGALLTLLVLALLAWLTLPSIVKHTLEQQLPAQTGRQFSVGEVRINPFTLSVRLSQVLLMEADRRSIAFSADELSVRLSWKSLVYQAPMLNQLTLIHPQLHVVRTLSHGQETSNFSDIIARFASKPVSKAEPLRWSVSNITLKDGELAWDDRVAGKQIHVEKITLGLPFLSNFPSALDLFVEPQLSARIDGSLFALKVRSKPFSTTLETSVALDIDRFDLTEVLPFFASVLPVKVPSAQLASHLVLNFSNPREQPRVMLSGQVSLLNVAITDLQGEPLFSGKQIDASLKEVDLLTTHIALDKLSLLEPQIWAGFDQQAKLNWLVLNRVAPSTAPGTKPGAKLPVTPAPLLELARVQIKDGTLHWHDFAYATPALTLDVGHIGVDVEHLSTAAKAPPATLSVNLHGDQKLSFVGSLSAAPMLIAGQLSMSDLMLNNFQPYLNGLINGSLSGKLGLHTGLDFRDGNLMLNQLAISLNGAQLIGKAVQFGVLSVGTIGADSVLINPATRQLQINQLAIENLQGDVFRDTQGQLNLSRLLKKTAAHPLAIPDDATTIVVPAWHTEVNQLSLTNGHLTVGDQFVQPALRLSADAIDLRVDHLSSNVDQSANIVLHTTVNKTGQFVVKGTVSPTAMQLAVDVKNFAVLPLQPYFTQFFHVTMLSGSLSTSANLSWKAAGDLSYQGSLNVAGLRSADKDTGDDFVRWDSLDIGGIDILLSPTQKNINLGKVVLNKFTARAVLSEKGQLNLKNILVQTPAPEPSPSSKVANVTPPALASGAVPVVMNVGDIDLSDGVINYTDNFIKPHYSMRLTGMQGHIGALHSTLAQAAPINLTGKIDEEAPIVISGSLNPLFSPMLLDIKMTASGVDLPKMTTYSRKYAGYPIVRGKLSLDVGYHLSDNQLKATNSLKIDQFSFGDQVPGPDATSLPVPLLVSLLTDADGRISLDLPIEGTLNDPEFSIGGLLARVFLNLIGKVLTSPFTLLAHAIEGLGGVNADELSTLEFEPGSAQLGAVAHARLATLGTALQQRPAMNLDILGRADLATDQAGIRRSLLDLALGQTLGSDGVAINTDVGARNRQIEKLYAAASFTKPRNLLGLAKTLPAADMEQLLLANIKVSDDDLQALALQRETVVQSYLSDVVQVSIERLFLVSPKLSGEGSDGKSVPCRVDFSLRM